ncbi:hypothetical protein ACFE04_022538 [Oxalis oulophora]
MKVVETWKLDGKLDKAVEIANGMWTHGSVSLGNLGVDNSIPLELGLKIATKIIANERFAVYVVILMWPEGAPSFASVQEILFWHGQTTQMMYEIIAQELKAQNIEHSLPQDYLNYCCLGYRGQIPNGSSPDKSEMSQSNG